MPCLRVIRAAIMTQAAVRPPMVTAIKRAGIMLAAAAAVCVVSPQANAQEQRYETPQYTTGGDSSLDKSYGLPSFGMPPQKTQEPAARIPEQPDFFARTPGYDVEKPRSSTALEMETPLFTTPEGSTTGDSTMTDPTFEPTTSDGTTSRYTNPR